MNNNNSRDFYNALSYQYQLIERENRNKELEKKAEFQNALQESGERIRKENEARLQRLERSSAKDKLIRTLLTNGLDYIFNEALKRLDINDTTNNRLGYLNEYMSQQNMYQFIRENKVKNYMLSDIIFEMEKTCDEVKKKCKEQDVELSVKVDNSEVDKYVDSIDKLEADRIAQIIADKVGVAIADFIIGNQKDKQEIEKTIVHSQQKIDSTIDESRIEYYENQCKAEIKKIRNKRFKPLFEMMINNVAGYTYRNNTEEFLSEGSLNLDKIKDAVTIMYTFLEFTNTMGLVKVDESYIKDVLNQMK